jgi:murein tripeptide amidase MpaA
MKSTWSHQLLDVCLQADYGVNWAQPDARQQLVAAIHGIAGRELISDFHDQRRDAQDRSAAPATCQPQQPDRSMVRRTAPESRS